MINKKKYPLAQLKAIENLYKSLRNHVIENSDILEIVKDIDLEIIIADRSRLSDFQFAVSEPKFEKGKAVFTATYNPENTVSLKSREVKTVPDSIHKVFKAWTTWIREYNKVNLIPEDKILNEYEKEFFENFELVDEDADTKPYELEKQVIIHNYLAGVIEILGANEQENKELIEEAEDIKETLPKMTKQATVKRISGFFAMVRKKSLPLLKELLTTGKKEIFKKVINSGFDYIGDLITMIG